MYNIIHCTFVQRFTLSKPFPRDYSALFGQMAQSVVTGLLL